MHLAVRWLRSYAALAAAFLFSNAWSAAGPGTLTAPADPVDRLYPSAPDLVVESANIELAEVCRPSKPLFHVSVTIHNRGKSPTLGEQWNTIVYARETYARSWGNGLRMPGIGEGERRSVTFPIYFLSSAPDSMAGTHKFVINVAAGNDIEEANYANNRFGPLTVEVPIARCIDSRLEAPNQRSAAPFGQ